MGLLFSSLFSALFGSREYRILILGLDNAGKTTILYRLQVDEPVTTVPTIGFNVETLQYKNIKFQVWDLGGQSSIRPYWRCYYPNTDAIIFVVDSTDVERLDTARAELHAMLEVRFDAACCFLLYVHTLTHLSTHVPAHPPMERRSRTWRMPRCSCLPTSRT